jgi:hypothetical protein
MSCQYNKPETVHALLLLASLGVFRLLRLLWRMLGCVGETCWAYSAGTCDWASRHAGVYPRPGKSKTHIGPSLSCVCTFETGAMCRECTVNSHRSKPCADRAHQQHSAVGVACTAGQDLGACSYVRVYSCVCASTHFRWKRPPWSQAVMWEPPEVVIIARPLNNNTGTKSRCVQRHDQGLHPFA